MELKFSTFLPSKWPTASSNRTFMELKLYASRASQLKLVGSNRTFMELKYTSSGIVIETQMF